MAKKVNVFQVIFNTVIIGFAACFLIFYLMTKEEIDQETKAENDRFTSVMSGCGQTNDQQILERPYIKGKMIVMEFDGEEQAWVLDDIWWSLPEEIKASDPSEVGTVVRAAWSHETYIEYSRGTSYRGVVTYAIIDCAKKAVIYSGKLTGEEPPGDNPISSGPLPHRELIGLLSALPKIP